MAKTTKWRIIWVLLMLIFIQGCYKTVKRENWSNGKLKSKEKFKKEENKIALHGKSSFYYQNEQLKTIQWYKNGILVKYRKGFYENGSIKFYDKILGITPMLDSIGDGFVLNYFLLNYFSTTYYENGIKESEGNYHAGKKQNERIFYDTLGKEFKRIYFVQNSVRCGILDR